MDDGGRTGGLQALLLMIGAVSAYATAMYAGASDVPHAAIGAVLAVAAIGLVGWLEVYAWRRRREEREEEERRRRAAAIAHLDFLTTTSRDD